MTPKTSYDGWPLQTRDGKGLVSTTSSVAMTRPACGVVTAAAVGVLLAASSGDALVANNKSAFVSGSVGGRRPCVRPRGAAGGMKCLAGAAEGGEAESADSSEMYAAMRRRLEELEASRRRSGGGSGSLDEQLQISGGRIGQPGGDTAADDGVWAYSGLEMKKAYYEAFWRARNLNKDVESRSECSGGNIDDGVPPVDPSSLPTSSPTPPQPRTILTTTAMDMIMSKHKADVSGETEQEEAAAPVQGLTQMYYLDESEELAPATSFAGAVAAFVPDENVGKASSTAAAAAPQAGVFAFEKEAWPVGLSQMFYVEDAHEEAAAAARALPLASRSFLREKFGVPGEVVQDLRQVELDHARLAMLAVLLSGAVGAGAGVPTGAHFMDAHLGLTALAQVARTPWLDPCVAGVILSVKALSEGDWRLGKGALAGWADKGLRAASDVGAKVLRLGSGEEMRKLAVEMEVRHGRLALGAVVCAMAQQGLLTVGA